MNRSAVTADLSRYGCGGGRTLWGCALVPLCPPVGRTAVAEAAMRMNGAALFAVHWRHGTGPRSLVCGDEADDYDDLAELQREAQGVHLSTALYLSGTA